jgi:hypothetical protein
MIGIQEIILLISLLVLVWFLIRELLRLQQQQQVVVHGEAQMKRICPKCDWQNDMDNKFCGD